MTRTPPDRRDDSSAAIRYRISHSGGGADPADRCGTDQEAVSASWALGQHALHPAPQRRARVRALNVLLPVAKNGNRRGEQPLVGHAPLAAAAPDLAVVGEDRVLRPVAAETVHLVLVADIAVKVVRRRTDL